ncbi:MAG: hypothetical protein J1F29_06310 [Lentimicrobiaceae bacterium]|nr:hypothetical protein [Lentimicrobiaceae bacterium]
MKTKWIIVWLSVFSTLAIGEVRAQASDSASLYMSGKVCGNQVRLRWAASTPELWQTALQYGWTLERYDFDTLAMGQAARKGTAYTPSRTQIDISPFLQTDTARIAAMADTDMYAAVLGEAVYNPDIALSVGGIAASPWDKISKEMERKQIRFALANVAYDRSFAVACLGKMGYVDTAVQPGHYYLYRLYAKGLHDTATLDTALYFTRLEAGSLRPPVQEIQMEYAYMYAALEWNIRFAHQQSVGYYVERAAETKKKEERRYVRLNATPLAVLQDNNPYTMRYADSLPDEHTRYAYRVIGVDLFGEEFVVAQSRLGKSGLMPLAMAQIDSVKEDEQGKRYLHWSYPEQSAASVKAFEVYAGSQPDWEDSQNNLLAAKLPPQTRRLAVNPDRLGVSTYFYVKAIGEEGKTTLSRSYFYWKKDSIPPLPPTGLAYTIDSVGIACITWKASVDADVEGYRVFRQTDRNAEPVQVTSQTLGDTVFFDTVSLNTLQSFYYSVRALDASGNLSKPSELLAVRNLLPDKPAPAVFSRRSQVESDRVDLVWYNSQTSNVRGHALYYRCDSSSWFLLKDFPLKENAPVPETSSFSFRFPDRLYSTRYIFNIVAYGSDKERDTVSSPFYYTASHTPAFKPPTPFAVVDSDNRYIQLQWKEKTAKPLRRVFVYRRAEKDKMRLLATLDAQAAEEAYYTDFSVKMNTEYAYVIQFEYADGLWSEYSAPCTVNY